MQWGEGVVNFLFSSITYCLNQGWSIFNLYIHKYKYPDSPSTLSGCTCAWRSSPAAPRAVPLKNRFCTPVLCCMNFTAPVKPRPPLSPVPSAGSLPSTMREPSEQNSSGSSSPSSWDPPPGKITLHRLFVLIFYCYHIQSDGSSHPKNHHFKSD